MRTRLLFSARRVIAMLVVAYAIGGARSSSAQAPAWVQLSPPAEVTLHVRDSRRDREIFFDQSGLVAVDDLAATRWSRIFFGANPVLVRGSGFAFYDFARDRIWAMSLPISDSLKLWTMDLADAAPAWTPQAYTWSNPALADTAIQNSALVFDDARDRLLSFGGYASLLSCILHCVPPGATNVIYQLQLAGTPQWSTVPVDGPAPGPRLDVAIVRDPWRDRVVIYGGVSFGPVLYDETWALSLGTPMTWTLLNPTVIPPSGRVVDSAVLDSLGRRWYIHGLQPGLGGGPPTYALDLSNSVNDADASWSEVAPAAGTVASYPAMTFIQPGQNRLVAMDGTSEWRLPLSAPTDWQLVPGAPLRRNDLVGFVDPVTQRLYAGLGPDDQFQWRPIGQEVPWTPLGTQGPTGFGASAGVDPVGGKVWVFGGHDQSDDVEYSDLWSMNLSTSQWSLASAGNPPIPRSEALGVFDSAHRRFIVHGGRYTNPSPVALGDTWVYDVVAGSWSSPPAGSYGLDYGEVGIYDPVRDRVLAFGGHNGVKDVHVLPLGATIGTWSLLATSGTPPDWSNEETLAAAYDPEADRMLVMGGVGTTALWALNLAGTPTWEQLVLAGPLPLQRRGMALAYDAAKHRLLIFGGAQIAPAQPGSDPGDVWAAVFPPGVVATELSLFSVDASPDGVTLRWYGSGSAASGTVYRREPGSAWRALGVTAADGLGHWSWLDRDVIPGAGYDYRLGVVRHGGERFFGETHVDVPLRSTFDLAGVEPNPSDGPLSVRFSLPGSAPATLELFDVTGRRLAERSVGGLGTGTHQLRLDSDRVRPAAGLYLVRLRQAGRERIARVVIAR